MDGGFHTRRGMRTLTWREPVIRFDWPGDRHHSENPVQPENILLVLLGHYIETGDVEFIRARRIGAVLMRYPRHDEAHGMAGLLEQQDFGVLSLHAQSRYDFIVSGHFADTPQFNVRIVTVIVANPDIRNPQANPIASTQHPSQRGVMKRYLLGGVQYTHSRHISGERCEGPLPARTARPFLSR